jgi:hypothetical protein
LWKLEQANTNTPDLQHAMPATQRPVVQSTENSPVAPAAALPASVQTNASRTSRDGAYLPQQADRLTRVQAPATSQAKSAWGSARTSKVVGNAPANPSALRAGEVAEIPSLPASYNIEAIIPAETPVLTAAEYRLSSIELLAQPTNQVEPETATILPEPRKVFIIPVEKSIADDANTSRWSFGLTAAVSTERFSSLNGLSGGVGADFRFSRKWGVRASTLYTRYLPSVSSQPVVAVEEVNYANATGLYTGSNFQPPTGVSASEETQYVYIPLRKLHQIELPVMLWWQPFRKLRLYSGVAVDYTFLGQSSDQNYINNEAVSLSNDVFQKKASRVATSELSHWQMNYQGGLGWKIGRHAEIGLSWHVPMHAIGTQKMDAAEVFDPTAQLDSQNSVSGNLQPKIGHVILQGTWMF